MDDVPLADVPKVISNYNICVVKNMRLDSNIIAKAKNMKLIMQYGVGLEGNDFNYFPTKTCSYYHPCCNLSVITSHLLVKESILMLLQNVGLKLLEFRVI